MNTQLACNRQWDLLDRKGGGMQLTDEMAARFRKVESVTAKLDRSVRVLSAATAWNRASSVHQ